jgi:hypothetical protein
MNVPETVHPEIRRGLEAVESPEVQELIKQLSKHGLAVALPHTHGNNGSFLPLPHDQVVFESDLQVSFLQKDSPVLKSAIPVMWRWNDGAEAVASCALCDFYAHPGQV